MIGKIPRRFPSQKIPVFVIGRILHVVFEDSQKIHVSGISPTFQYDHSLVRIPLVSQMTRNKGGLLRNNGDSYVGWDSYEGEL